ncbi:hypothetical protein K474DRAFT_1260783 [Panus rudis PR-1116 ss-1]|nr:hypothetical protein K474DRAFT_1260783 [Panus rudis PR-1116 ss-1]
MYSPSFPLPSSWILSPLTLSRCAPPLGRGLVNWCRVVSCLCSRVLTVSPGSSGRKVYFRVTLVSLCKSHNSSRVSASAGIR